MKINRAYIILLLIFVLGFAFRILPYLYLSHPLGVDIYQHMRFARYLLEGQSLDFDPYSHGGRELTGAYGYEYVLAGFGILFDLEFVSMFIIPLIGSLSIIVVFFIARKFVDDKYALLSSFVVATFQSVITRGIGAAPTNISLFLISLIFLFLFSPRKYSVVFAGILSLILVFISQEGLVLIPLLMIYPFLSKGGKIKYLAIVFAAIMAFMQFDFLQSPSTGTPSQLRYITFGPFSAEYIFINLVNPLVLFLGVASLAFARNRKVFLTYLWFLVPVSLSIISLIEPERTLALASLPLSVLSAITISKISSFHRLVFPVVLVVMLVWLPYQAYGVTDNLNWGVMDEREYEALQWISENTPENSTVASTPGQGYWIAYFDRKNIMDGAYMEGDDKRFEDVRTLFETDNEETAKNVLQNYSAGYIYFSDSLGNFQNWPESRMPSSIDNWNSFRKIFDNGFGKVYKSFDN